MPPRRAVRCVVLLATLSVLLPSRLHAMASSGFSNEGAIGARALGRYNALTADADDATALFFNPAGLTQLDGWQVSLNDNILDLNMRHHDFSGQRTDADIDILHVPSLFIVRGHKELGFSYGIGVYSQFGLETNWPGDSFAKYDATLSRFHTITINPTVAFAASPEFSMGVGLDFVDAPTVDLRKKVNVSLINGVPAPDGESRQEATGSGLGMNLGFRFAPGERHALGLSYRSPVTLHLHGTQKLTGLSGAAAFLFGGPDYETGATARITLPQSVMMGYAFHAAPRWSIETDAQWTDWTSVDNFHVAFDDADPVRQSILNAGIDPLNRDWRAVWSLGAGTEYALTDRWSLRAGGGYIWGAIPEESFDASLPDSDRIEATTGVSRRFGRGTFLHLAYNAAFFKKRSVSNDVAGGSINGIYETFVNSWAVGVEQRF